jgi:CubicO group peptidase (beta-lactamase class C family)
MKNANINRLVIIATLVTLLAGSEDDLPKSEPRANIPQIDFSLPDYISNIRQTKFENTTSLRDSTALNALIETTMVMEHIPGAATWASKNGQVIWQKCYGLANIEDSVPVADTTLFMLASISKTITATAIMQLWERGAFGLFDDVNDYLSFNVRNPNNPNTPITFYTLLTHTSSIADNWSILGPLYTYEGDSPISLDSFLSNYLVPGGIYYNPSNYYTWPPGGGGDYSNVGVALLGYLVEAIEDSFPVHCQDSIFQPLSMDETSWFLANLDPNNIAVPYHWNGSSYTPYRHYGYPDYPDGQLRTSATQLAQHLTAFMQYGQIDTVRMLDSATVDLMTTVQYQATPTLHIGLIWWHHFAGTRWVWGHGGGDDGVSTRSAFCPEENSAVIVLTNSESDDGPDVIENALFDYATQLDVAEHKATMPAAMNLQVAPNPFHSKARIRYSILDPGYSTKNPALDIYDASGRLVKSFNLESKIENQGSAISWRGDDDAGRELPCGVYFVKLTSGEFEETKKVLLVR